MNPKSTTMKFRVLIVAVGLGVVGHVHPPPRPALAGRERFLQALAEQPLPCPACGAPLVVDQVQFPRASHEKASPRSPPRGTGPLSLPM